MVPSFWHWERGGCNNKCSEIQASPKEEKCENMIKKFTNSNKMRALVIATSLWWAWLGHISC